MPDQERKFQGIWIPANLWFNEELNWTEKLLLLEIDSLDNEKGCFASNEYLAKMFRRSVVTISKSISKMKEMGLVDRVDFDGRKRTIFLKADLKKTLRQTNRKLKGEINRLDNNTSSKEEDSSPSVKTDGRTIVRCSSPGRHWALEYWNSLSIPPGIPKHKNPTTKTYKQASRYLTQLHSGTFLNGKPRVRSNLENFFQERRIPFVLAERAWPQREILQGLKRLSKVFYLNTQVKSLAALIYNPYSPYKYYSHFFDAFYNYKQVNWRIENKEEEPLEKYVIYIHKKIGDQEED